MKVQLWVDVRCPWTWVTSRWLVNDVAPHRDISMSWRPMSLMLAKDIDESHEKFDKFAFTHGLLRVMTSVKASDGNAGFEAAYGEFGSRVWQQWDWSFDPAEALRSAGLDPSHAKAFEKPSWDAGIQESMAAAYDLIGQGIGNTPIIAIPGPEGGTAALYGPVLSQVPSPEESLVIWDATIALLDSPSFAQLQRATDDLPKFPDTA